MRGVGKLASWSVVDTALTCTLVLGDYL